MSGPAALSERRGSRQAGEEDRRAGSSPGRLLEEFPDVVLLLAGQALREEHSELAVEVPEAPAVAADRHPLRLDPPHVPRARDVRAVDGHLRGTEWDRVGPRVGPFEHRTETAWTGVRYEGMRFGG